MRVIALDNVLCRHEERIDVFESVELGLVDLVNQAGVVGCKSARFKVWSLTQVFFCLLFRN